MELLSFGKFRLTNPNIRVLGGPLVAIIVLAFLFLFLIENGYTRIFSEVNKLKAATKEEKTLKEKVSLLMEVRKDVLESSDETVIALPYENPGLLMLGQLNKLATDYSLAMSEVSLANETAFGDDARKMEITFEGETLDEKLLVNFLKDIEGLAPVSSVESVALKKGVSGNVTAQVKLLIYWSDLPTTLPSITEPVKELTRTEQDLLNKVTSLSLPQIKTIPATQPVPRENPFQ